MARSKSELVLENALLRQQLIILQRQGKRPTLTWRDQTLFVLLASKLPSWKTALLIVQPDTLLRWHRDLFRRVWRRKSQLQAAPLIYHELVPGHHFHLASQFENDDLAPIRRNGVIELDGYIEGWAEYAADLPKGMGLYDDPYDLCGRLVHERFIAQRLVVDTEMNLFGWSLERGQSFMRANTMESETQIASETLRCSTDMPAQSLAYRLGYLKIAELREKAERELGSAFDLRAFHQAILGPGALPLSLLEEQIGVFIQESAHRQKPTSADD